MLSVKHLLHSHTFGQHGIEQHLEVQLRFLAILVRQNHAVALHRGLHVKRPVSRFVHAQFGKVKLLADGRNGERIFSTLEDAAYVVRLTEAIVESSKKNIKEKVMKSIKEMENISLEQLEAVSMDMNIPVPEGFEERLKKDIGTLDRLTTDDTEYGRRARTVRIISVAAAATLLLA